MNSELYTAWTRQLKEDWRNANYSFFKNALRLPNIGLMDSENLLGKWVGSHQRVLSINVPLIRRHPWGYVQEVLYHEMAHQYVEEILGFRDALPHGEAFRRICNEHEIDPTAKGDLQTWVQKKKERFTAGTGNHKILDKVHKLLALAQSTNQYEAQAAMEKAHELLLKHNLSLLEAKTKGNYIHKQMGEVGRKNPVKSLIGTIIGKFFFVETLWVYGFLQHKNKKGRILEIYGTPENVEMAEYVHDYLHNISDLWWKEYKREKKITGDKNRRTFIYGLLSGFYNKLDSQTVSGKSHSLIWKGDPRLKEYYRRRNPKIRYSVSRYSRRSKAVYESGISRGKTLVVHKGIHEKKREKVKLLN